MLSPPGVILQLRGKPFLILHFGFIFNISGAEGEPLPPDRSEKEEQSYGEAGGGGDEEDAVVITGLLVSALHMFHLAQLVPGVETLAGGLLTLARHIGRLHRGDPAVVVRLGVDQETHDDVVGGDAVLGAEGGLQGLQLVAPAVRTGRG